MELRTQYNCNNIDWNRIPQILKTVGMGSYEAETHKKAFENSYTVVFVFDGDKLIGFGRAISDGAYQAGLYDIAVLPEYQGKGIGKMIVTDIIKSLPNCNFILYAAVGKEGFYERQGFRRMRTGMALFLKADEMQKNGFTD